MHTIAASELGRLLGLSEPQLHELARRAGLPFSVSTGRGLIVPADDVELWRAAVDAAAAVIRDLKKPPRRKRGARGGVKATRSV
jgi:hypothetical protein